MTKNGHIRLAIPPGHVEARCLVCPADVIIPEGTLKCPNGDHDVEPTSLPRMPKMTRSLAEVDSFAVTPLPTDLVPAPVVAMATPVKPAVPPPVAAAPEPERIELPSDMLDWYADTSSRRDRAASKEAELVAELKRVRQARKLLDGLLARIVEPTSGPPIVVTLDGPPAPAPTLAIEPLAPGQRPWSTLAPRCINCGTTERSHGAKGRCTRCTSYWSAHAVERPANMPPRGGMYSR